MHINIFINTILYISYNSPGKSNNYWVIRILLENALWYDVSYLITLVIKINANSPVNNNINFWNGYGSLYIIIINIIHQIISYDFAINKCMLIVQSIIKKYNLYFNLLYIII